MRPLRNVETEKAELLDLPFVQFPTSTRLDAGDLFHYTKLGFYPTEMDERIYFTKRSKREIIPIREHTPKGAKGAIYFGNYSISTNTSFDYITDICARPRKPGASRWLGGRLQYLLYELHRKGQAHSLEVWRENEIVGGVLGIQTGAIFISFSAFGSQGAGNAGMVELQARLARASFALHDAVQPSNISTLFGGGLVEEKSINRDALVRQPLVFPTDPVILPAKEFPQQPQRKATQYGWAFTR